MKSEILKIAGVKSEKEFYKKYPTEAAFMKVHKKAFKKAQIGTLIGGGSPKQSVSKPLEPINFQELYDENDKLITGSTQAERDKAAYDQAVLQSAANQDGSSGGGLGGIIGGVGDMIKLFGDQDGKGMDMPDLAMSRYGSNIPVAQVGYYQNNQTGFQTNYQQPKQKFQKPPIVNDDDFTPSVDGYTYQGPTDSDIMKQGMEIVGDTTNPAGKGGGFMDALGKLGKFAEPLSIIGGGINDYIAGQRELQNKKRDTMVSDFARMASATREEESKRRYVRPEDIQNTGEEFFPIYGVGTNVLTKNGGEIRRSQNGSMIGGNPTEIQNTYGSGRSIYDDLGYVPLIDEDQDKNFRHGGYLHLAKDGFWSGGADPNLYGQLGGLGAGIGQAITGGQNAGGRIGGTLGKVAGTALGGPLGGFIGETVLGTVGNLADTTGRDMKKEDDKQKANLNAMTLNSQFQGLQETHNRYVRNGGDIPSYEDGGYMNPEYNPQVITMFGDHTAEDFADYARKYRAGGHLKSYTPPSERAMETYAMGGQLQTHWGGGAETMSYNPYSAGSGETVLFRGQSHTESDDKGNTGIGITYGENPVEVERGEPMFEMEAGGEINPETGKPETTGVVFGNMQIDKKVAAQLNDPELMKVVDIYDKVKFKNAGLNLAKQEAKQNKIIEKNSKLLDSFKVEKPLDKPEFYGLEKMIEGANAKLKDIANTKIILANYQNAINDAKEELSEVIGQNLSAEDLARGYTKLDKDPVTKNAKWGGNIIKKAQTGVNTTTAQTTKPSVKKVVKGRGDKWSYTPAGDTGNSMWDDMQRYEQEWTPTVQKALSDKDRAKRMLEYINSSYGDESEKVKKSLNKFNTEEDKINFLMKEGTNKQVGPIHHVIDAAIKYTVPGMTTPLKDQVKEAPKEKPKTTPIPYKREPLFDIANQFLEYLRPTDQEGFDTAQIYPEMYAMASNQVEPVPAQSYQPDLIVPYDISLQAQRNAVMSAVRNRQKQLGYNPAAQANMAPAEYNAINEINEKEFMANQGLKNQVYTGNVNTMNAAKKTNLEIFADQWTKQSQARSNTKATTQAALNSIADKYAKNRLENRTLGVYENLYKYRYDASGRAINMNPLFQPNIGTVGSVAGTQVQVPVLDEKGNIVRYQLQQYDPSANGGVGTPPLQPVGKNGKSITKNNKNSSIVKAFKNL